MISSHMLQPCRHGHMKETTSVVADVGGEQAVRCGFSRIFAMWSNCAKAWSLEGA